MRATRLPAASLPTSSQQPSSSRWQMALTSSSWPPGPRAQQEFLEQGAVFFAHASGRPFFQARFQLFLVLLHGLAELLEGGGVEQLPGAWE